MMHGMNTPAVASPRWGDATAGVRASIVVQWLEAIEPLCLLLISLLSMEGTCDRLPDAIANQADR